MDIFRKGGQQRNIGKKSANIKIPDLVCRKIPYATQCRRMKFQKVPEFAKQIPTGFRNRAE